MKNNLLRIILFSFVFSFIIGNTIDAQTVYITKTGKKYHKGSCRYLRSSKISISLEDAKAKGYTPCSVCKPPTKVLTENEEVKTAETIKVDTTNIIDKKEAVPVVKSVAVQCKGITKSGSRCKRKTTNANGYCWQHQDQAKKKK